MVVEYLEGWLNGRGAKGIDSLAGKPGIHPALMEDLATGRMSVAQIAQRVRHGARDSRDRRRPCTTSPSSGACSARRPTTSSPACAPTVKDERGRAAFAEAETRYRKAEKIAMRWIKNYTDLDFRSLGAYTRADLEAIAAAPDAF